MLAENFDFKHTTSIYIYVYLCVNVKALESMSNGYGQGPWAKRRNLAPQTHTIHEI